MGNILCKNRVNHSNNPKSPVDRVLGRCAQICPKSLGKQKQFWDKQVLETSPPLQNQPKTDSPGWNSASLTVPDSPQADGVDHPIAPPRKKRPSMLRKDDHPIRNGFKDIFSGNRSESTTTSDSQGDAKDFTDFEKVPLNRGSAKEREKEKVMEKTVEKSMEKTREKSLEKIMEKPKEKLMEKPMENPLEKWIENPTVIPIEKPTVKPIENAIVLPMEKPIENPIVTPNVKPMETETKLVAEKGEIEEITESVRTNEKQGEAVEAIESAEPDESKSNTLSHKALKIGNKKSDKFFGENLSDSLSDVPLVQQVEEEILKIQQAMLQPSSKDSKIEEAEGTIKQQLLASLSTFKDMKVEESIDEPDRVAVEEPIITKVIIRRHVCDDEDELRAHLHSDHDYDHTYVVPDPNAPKKPQRDFTKYKKQNEESTPPKGDNVEVEVSTEGADSEMALDLLSQIRKELPPSNSILIPKTKIASVDVVDSSISQDAAKLVAVISESLAKGKIESTVKVDKERPPLEPVSEPLIEKMSQSEEALRSELSTQTFLTPDMMEHIAQQVKMAEDYQPEDYSSSNDGSEIAPNSKLVQKRSLSSQTSYAGKQNNSSNSHKEPINKPIIPLIIQKVDVSESHEGESENDPKEPETPPVFYKLTRPSPLLGSNDEIMQDITSEKSVTKKRRPQEVQAKIQISPESANENISKAIKSFMEQDGLQPEDILALLEEEFGELLHVSSLPGEDQKLIDDLRNAVHRRNSTSDGIAPENAPKVSVNRTEPPVSETQASPKIILQVASEDTLKEAPKVTPEVNASIVTVVPSPASKVLSEDKRRHSIDEFDHWFAGGLSRKVEVPMRKRKREASLPGCLFTDSSVEEMGTFRQRLNINKDRSKDDTDDVLNKQHTTVITTTAIHIFDPIPESIRPASPASEKTDVTIIELNPNSEDEHETLEVAHKEKTERNNGPRHPIARGQKNRTSVGHSLLLKFLDVERSNSFK